MNYNLYQVLTPTPSQPAVTWRQDTVLDTPFLLGPLNQSNICLDSTFVTASGTGVLLTWNRVTNATFYVVQFCNNSSFSGPTLQGKKVADPGIGTTASYELKFRTEVRIGEEIFWRVMAYNTTGGVSFKSTTFQLIYECPEVDGDQGQAQQPKPGGGGGSGQNGSACSRHAVKMKITGPALVFCCDKSMWHLSLSYDCLDENGNEITLTSVTWSLAQSGVTSHTIVSQDSKKVIVQSGPSAGNDVSEQFTVKATALFTFSGGGEFTCSDEMEITTDCDTGRPTEKPWLRLNYSGHYGLITYISDDYVRSAPLNPDTLNPAFTEGGVTLLREADQFMGAIATGPVVVVSRVRHDTEDPESEPCDNDGMARGDDTEEIHEARVHIPMACHIYAHEQELSIDVDSLAGRGLKSSAGSRVGGDDGCPQLDIRVGCGVMIGDEADGYPLMADRGSLSSGNAYDTCALVLEGELAGQLLPSDTDGATETAANLTVFGNGGAAWGTISQEVSAVNRWDTYWREAGHSQITARMNDEWRALPFTPVFLGKTNAAINKSASGTVNIYVGASKGAEAASGKTVTAYNRFADLEINKWVLVVDLGNGPELIAAEC